MFLLIATVCLLASSTLGHPTKLIASQAAQDLSCNFQNGFCNYFVSGNTNIDSIVSDNSSAHCWSHPCIDGQDCDNSPNADYGCSVTSPPFKTATPLCLSFSYREIVNNQPNTISVTMENVEGSQTLFSDTIHPNDQAWRHVNFTIPIVPLNSTWYKDLIFDFPRNDFNDQTWFFGVNARDGQC